MLIKRIYLQKDEEIQPVDFYDIKKEYIKENRLDQ